MEDSFIIGDPGCTKYGNFINYYNFNSLKSRLELIPENILESLNDLNGDILILDIGCNSGNLTLGLYDHLIKPTSVISINILAIDIDGSLIERCLEKSHNYDKILFKKADIMMDSDRQLVIDKYLQEKKATKFDLVFALSLTMWIHLNNGDEGLANFLTYISLISRYLFIEPQPWRCYKNAERRNKRAQKSLITKSNDQMSPDFEFTGYSNYISNFKLNCNSNNILINTQIDDHKSLGTSPNKFLKISYRHPEYLDNKIKIYSCSVGQLSSYNLESFNISLSNLNWRHKVDDLIIDFLTINSMQIIQKFGKTKWGRGLTLLKNINLF